MSTHYRRQLLKAYSIYRPSMETVEALADLFQKTNEEYREDLAKEFLYDLENLSDEEVQEKAFSLMGKGYPLKKEISESKRQLREE